MRGPLRAMRTYRDQEGGYQWWWQAAIVHDKGVASLGAASACEVCGAQLQRTVRGAAGVGHKAVGGCDLDDGDVDISLESCLH